MKGRDVCLFLPCGQLLGKGLPIGSRLWFITMFATFPLVSWVRCGTLLCRFLIFTPLLTFMYTTQKVAKDLDCLALIIERLHLHQTINVSE